MTKQQTVQIKRDCDLDMLSMYLESLRGQGIIQRDERLNALFTEMYNYVCEKLNDGIDGEIVDMYMVYEVAPNKPVTPFSRADTVSNTATV